MTQPTTGRHMRLGLFPQTDLVPGDGPILGFQEMRAVAQAAEQIGFDSLWIADHLLLQYPNQPVQGCWECFTLLGGLAAATSRLQLGSLVACTSFRSPALLAKMAENLDEMSQGRFILGLGAGWHEPEYLAFGFPFDHLVDRFEEAIQIIAPLLRTSQVDVVGTYSQARHTVLLPRGPSRTGPPIWIGARRPRMLELTARYADAWNVASWDFPPARIAQDYPKMVATCEAVGRDPATLEVTANVMVHLLAPEQKAPAGAEGIVGEPAEVAEALRGFVELGVKHLVVSVTPGGVAGVERFGRVLELLDQD